MCSRNSGESPWSAWMSSRRLQPAVGACLHVVERGVGRLVHPVRGHAGFGDPVHVGGADLDLDRRAEGAEQDRVQRLVAVGLGDRDVVLELAGNRLVQRMQRTQRQIAGRLVAHHHAKTVDVEHFGKRQVLFLHLAVDAVEVLFAAGDGGLDLAMLELFLQRDLDLVDQFAAVAARRLDCLGQHLVAVGVAVAEAEVFQFLVHGVQAQPVGDRARRFPAFRVAMRLRFSAGIAPRVCMLCRRSASLIRMTRTSRAIASSILRKFSACACCSDANASLSSLDTPSTSRATALPKRASISLAGGRRVFHHVVQQRGDQGLRVEMPAGQDAGDGKRVGDVGFAALAELAFVGAAAEFVGLLDLADFVRRQIGQGRTQRFEFVRHRRRAAGVRRLTCGWRLRHGLG